MAGKPKLLRRAAIGLCLFAALALQALQAAERPAARDPSPLNQQFQAAVSLFQNHQYNQAQQILTGLLRQAPNDFQLNELMGLVCTAQNRAGQANPYLAKAVSLQPRSAEARMYLAANLVDLHQNARAESEFKQAVRLKPEDYNTNHNLGEFYIHTGRLALAIPSLAKAQQVNPSSYTNGYDLALAEIKTGKYREARESIEHLLHYQNQADLHSLLAAAEEKSGQYLEAAKEYGLAARMDPSADNIFAWGSELLLHHTLEPAVQVFKRGVELYPRSAKMEIGLGIALYSRTYYQEAIDSFCRAIDLNPDDPRPYTFLGKIYDASPLQAPAVTDRFARFARLRPRNPQALYYYALSLWKGSRTEAKPADVPKIERLFERAVALDPQFAEARLQLGILYAQQRRYDEAIAQYRQAIQSQPDLADAHYHLGEALVRTGKKAEAERQFQTFNRLHEQQV
ncbi:MAG TPA: tetratricopeptide repeat protein, partial [Terriglobia bacterium]|nr:tetratricopeptide repeat protein [Terriglobia bacterium]